MRYTQEDMFIIQEKFPKFTKVQLCMINNKKYGIKLSDEADKYLNERKSNMNAEYSKGQKNRIIQYLNNNGSITAYEAVKYLGILQLSARICELEKAGYVFDKVSKTAKNEYGTFRYVTYSLAA